MEQRSSEWFAIRRGKMTASKASVIATGGVGLETYILELMAEYYSNAEQEQLTNKDIERGIELEPQARMAFEFKTGLTVHQIGFIEYNEYIGCSPDGLIGSDGLVEFKAVRELGSERRETVRSLSTAGVRVLKRSVLSTRGPGWTNL